MAELIDRNKLLSILEKYKFGGISSDIERDFIKEVVIGFVKCMPTVTTTESEIRAMAQRAIVEWCFDNKVDFTILERYADKERVVDCVLKHFMAEQLKGESE